jgi:hypothetical protein
MAVSWRRRGVPTRELICRILNPKAGEWPTFNGNEWKYSPLTAINKSNVSS